MKRTAIYGAAVFLFLCTLLSSAALGQSEVITLRFPYGARSYAMGEVGTALADDESVMFFNPAGLDVPNDRWRGGAGTFFYEPLLPVFKAKNLYHFAAAAKLHFPDQTWGQFGFFVNRIHNAGGFSSYHDWAIGPSPCYETVAGLGWGFDLKDLGVENQYFGITAKWFMSVLYNSMCVHSCAFDLGYIWAIGRNFRFGAALMNLGPAVDYRGFGGKDPIPFTINCAAAYKREFLIQDLKFCSVAAELRLDREVVKDYPDKSPDPFFTALWTDLLNDRDETFKEEMHLVNEHLGAEVTFLNTLSLRGGLLVDAAGGRYEFHGGVGLSIYDHFSFGWGIVRAPEGYLRGFSRLFDPDNTGATGVRNGQWQISFTATRFLDWNENDRYWWKKQDYRRPPFLRVRSGAAGDAGTDF